MISYLNSAEHVVEELAEHEFILAKDQPQYRPLPALHSAGDEGKILTRWTFTLEERLAIAAGADLFLEVWTFRRPFPPVKLCVSDNPASVVVESFGG